MNVVLLGASGFLGSTTYNMLKQNARNNVVGTCFKAKENKDLIALDVTNHNSIDSFFCEYKPDAVIWCLNGKENEKNLIENGLKNILNFINGKRFIFVSTDAFAEGMGNYSEDSILTYFNQVNPLSSYANAKIDGEKMMMRELDNYIIVRTGPIYGQDANGYCSQREKVLIEKLNSGEQVSYASNLFKTFVHIDDLASALCEMPRLNYKGVIHAGPVQKESYFTFSRKRAELLELDASLITPYIISENEAAERGIPLDTSMNTQKCRDILKARFRSV